MDLTEAINEFTIELSNNEAKGTDIQADDVQMLAETLLIIKTEYSQQQCTPHAKTLLKLERRLEVLRRLALMGRPRTTVNSTCSLSILEGAHAQLHMTIGVAEATATELRRQNEQTQQLQDKAREVNSGLAYARTLLHKMSQWWR